MSNIESDWYLVELTELNQAILSAGLEILYSLLRNIHVTEVTIEPSIL